MICSLWNRLRRCLFARRRSFANQSGQASARAFQPLLEPLEDRLTPSWSGAPPALVTLPQSAPQVALNPYGDASGSARISSNEVDWYRLAAPVSGTYEIHTDAPASEGIVLAAYNASGARLASQAGWPTTPAGPVTLSLVAGGVYFIGVTNQTGTPGGDYTWSVNGPPVDDAFENNDTQASAFNLGALTSIRILNGLRMFDDADWYRFSTSQTAGATALVRLHFLTAEGDLNLELYDAAGTRLAAGVGQDGQEVLALAGLAKGTYFLRVFGADGAWNGNYNLLINPPSATPGDDAFEDNDTQATAFDLGTAVRTRTLSSLKMTDAADWFRFSLDVTGAASGGTATLQFTRSQGDLDIALYDVSGILLGTGVVAGNTEAISLTGLPSGSYQVRVVGVAGAFNPAYSLTLTAPTNTTWYTQTLTDPALRDLVRQSNTSDALLSRSEMLDLFRQVGQDGVVSAAEFNDLKAVVNNTAVIYMTDPVRNLAKKVVLGNPANARYQGGPLGNLAAGNVALKLEKLVNKWFLGLDHPVAASNSVYVRVDGSLFGDAIRYEDVRQGQVGDCYFLAALGAIARQNNDVIRTMFIDNGDDTWTVRFYRSSSTADYVTVDRFLPTRNGGLLYANMGDGPDSDTNILWVALAEKAYAQVNESGWLGRYVSANSYASIEAGLPSDATAQVTGKAASWQQTTEVSFSTLQNSFTAGKIITFGSNFDQVASYLVPNHAYVLVGYDAVARTVTLFNPWGIEGGYYNGSQRDGLVTLTMDQLRGNFGYWFFSI